MRKPMGRPFRSGIPTRTSWEDRQSLAEEYEQACTEYVCDYYADMGIIADPVNGGGL